ncbi:MAG: DUF2239 family protein [Aquabacterium sp.]|nr:MAG: DUF2239 family protein [Aquabacterium sp.]
MSESASPPPATYTSFDGPVRIASGSLQSVALVVKRALQRGAEGPILIFDDATGRPFDIDTRGSEQEVLSRLPQPVPRAAPADEEDQAAEPRGRGRPKLGVVAREVTLLPRHWEWLAAQPGGASVALRKLVEHARRANGERDRVRATQERAYHFMSAMAGHLEHFEEASRALFAADRERFAALVAGWPADVRQHLLHLAQPAWSQETRAAGD